MKNIRPKTIDFRALRLSAEEGFVLSRVDAPTSMRELVTLTGIEENRVVEIVSRLATQGALDVDEDAFPPGRAPPSSRSMLAAPPAQAAPVVPESEGSLDELIDEGPVEAIEEAPTTDPSPEALVEREHRRDDDDSAADLAAAEAEVAAEEPQPEEVTQETKDLDDVEAKILDAEAKNERAWRKIYETVYHKMERDGRIAAARTVDGANLMALCYDPEPTVVFALLSNPKFGLEQARFLAFHHRTNVGIEMLARHLELLKDQLVQRRLLRNPMLPDMVHRRIMQPKLITETYKVAIDREIPERTRVKTQEILRRKFTVASGDERAGLVIRTEGRCLILLTNCAFDAQTTQILCSRTQWSLICIQNLARWSATPPQLLRHLLKQSIVRQNVGIRKMLLKHPNMPSDVKRAFNQGQS